MRRRQHLNPRPWYWDALAALAFFGNGLLVGKIASRAAGPIAGLFFLLINFGLGYSFARSAWRELLDGRSGR